MTKFTYWAEKMKTIPVAKPHWNLNSIEAHKISTFLLFVLLWMTVMFLNWMN